MLALDIARRALGSELDGKTILPLQFAMSRDAAVLRASHETAASAVRPFLDAGQDVAMLNLGDVSIYATFGYLQEILQAQGYATAMAAGVPSFCAAAARLNQPLTGGMDAPLTIAPGSRADKVLDVPGTKVLMKTGRQLPALLDAGLDSVNISLDTLRAERFREITRRGDLEDAFAGIRAAEDAGFQNLKLDTVLMGGVNDDEIEDFLNLTKEHPWEVRFIELMPMGPCAAWPKERFLPVTEILNRFPALEEIEPNGVARRYRLPGAMGAVGLITPMSHEFCGACRRIRVTADGKLKGCLHSREEISLRGLHGRELEDAILRGILHKPKGHHLTEHASDTPRTMNEIGG